MSAICNAHTSQRNLRMSAAFGAPVPILLQCGAAVSPPHPPTHQPHVCHPLQPLYLLHMTQCT